MITSITHRFTRSPVVDGGLHNQLVTSHWKLCWVSDQLLLTNYLK